MVNIILINAVDTELHGPPIVFSLHEHLTD